jgi:hypothetical protein
MSGIVHGKYQVLPEMSPEQFAALKADIAERGILHPIDVDENGVRLDGHHRGRAADELGITDIPTIVRLGLSETEKRTFARKSNTLRRHLTNGQFSQLVADQLRDTPHWSNSRMAHELGVDDKTVATVRASLEATSEIPKLDRLVGLDGKARPRRRRPPTVLTANLIELSRVLEKTKTQRIGDLHGFLSAEGFTSVTVTSTYNPFVGRTDQQIRDWSLFALFLVSKCGYGIDGASNHVDWLLRRFMSVDESLGDAGSSFRRRCGMSPIPVDTLRAWAEFTDLHANRTRADIEKELEQAVVHTTEREQAS